MVPIINRHTAKEIQFWLSIQKLRCIYKPPQLGNRQTFSSDLDFLNIFQGSSISASSEMVQKESLECFNIHVTG